MKISLLQDYKIFDAGSKPAIEMIIEKIVKIDNEIEIDFSRCIIDYPATSLLIDHVMTKLIKIEGKRSLIITTHLDISELLLLHWFFIGSAFFSIDSSQKKSDLEEFTKVLDLRLSTDKVNMEIRVLNNNEDLVKTYKYGYQYE